MAFAALTIDLNARLAKFEDDMGRVRKSMGGLEKSAGVLKAGLGGLFAGVGVAGLVAFAKNGIDAADALKDMSDRLGVSVKDLASFKLAAEQSGTELEGVGKGIARLTRSIGEAEGGNKKLGEALKALGITARDPKEAFFQLADATEKIQDPAKRAALLSQVLGKSYQDLIPLLSQGSVELRKSAQGSETFAQAMERLAPDADLLNDNLAKLKENAAGFAATLLGPVAKAMNETIEGFKRIGRLSDAGASFDDFFFGTVNANTGKSLRNINKEIDGVETRIKRAKGFGIFGDTAPLERELTRLKAIRAELHNLSVEQAQAPHKSNRKSPLLDINLPTDKTSKSRGSSAKAIDPLASLLSQTDTAKFAEYTKLQDLLNARFEKGAINGKQYAEALAVLRKGYYTDELKAYAEQLEYNLETERQVAEHLKGTTDALFEQRNAWADAGRALEDEMRTPLEKANIEFGRLQELLDRGAISWETYSRAVFKAGDDLDGYAEKASEEVDDFTQQAARKFQSALGDFLFDPFKDGLDGMLKQFGSFVQRAIADAVAADLTRRLFGDTSKSGGGLFGSSSGSGGGGIGGWISAIAGLFGFASGGVMTARGPMALSAYASGGIATGPSLALFGEGSQNEAFVPLPDGKRIPVAMNGGGGQTIIVNVNVNGSNNAPDVRRAAGQGAREALGMFSAAKRYS